LDTEIVFITLPLVEDVYEEPGAANVV